MFQLIERFSEDIDLSLRRDYLGFGGENDPEKGGSNTQKKKLVEALRKKCKEVVQDEVKISLTSAFQQKLGMQSWSLESDAQDENTLNFTYPATIVPDALGDAYIRGIVKLEMGVGSDPYPIGVHSLQPYAAEEFPSVFAASSCNVIAMEAERTFWEKATLLHAEYHRPQDKQRPHRISRHYYDLIQIAKSETGRRALADQDLLARVVTHKSLYFASSWANYETAKLGTLHLLPPVACLEEVRHDYSEMKDMFFGNYPTFEELMADVEALERRLNSQI